VSFPERVDSTALSAARLCSRQWYWNWLRHMEPKASSIHLVAGGAYARGLEVARRLFYTGDPRFYLNIDACLPYAWRAAVDHWGFFEANPEENKQLWRILEAIDLYFREFPPASDHVQPMRWGSGKPAIEFTFAFPLQGTVHPVTGNPILYTGRLDMIGERSPGSLWLVDDKTCSQLGAQWAYQWDLRSQFLGYMSAISDAVRKPVEGCLVRGMCFRKHGYETAEKLVHFHQWQAEEWLDGTTRLVQRLIDEHQQGRYDKAYSDACNMYGGCNFRDLCTHRDPEAWVNADYQQFTWDPLTLESRIIHPQGASS
jgi:hypothetical protein